VIDAAASEANRATKPAEHRDEKHEWPFLAPPQQADEIGRLGPYRVLKVLGQGGMGVVFLAQDPQLRRLVALKAMLPEFAVEPTARRRFLREARAAAGLKHDHIVAIHHVGEERGAPFFVMELLEGESLLQRLRRSPLPVGEVLRIGREVADGLAAAHAGGVIHRDIKPANIWLEGQGGRAIILDFGLARTTLLKETRLSLDGQIMGTPAYMAPEQIATAPVDFRCDLYSLGVVLFEMATGRPPFVDREITALLMAVVERAPPEPRTLNPALSAELSAYILRLMDKDPADRPANAQTVAAELAALATATRKFRRRWAPIAAGALVLTGILALGLLAIVTGGALWRPPAHEEEATTPSPGTGTTKAKTPPDVPVTTKQPKKPPVDSPVEPAPFDDRQAALWAISTGGNVGIFARSGLIAAVSDLPEGTWKVGYLAVGIKNKVGDADLKRLKALTKLQQLILHNTQVSDAGLEHIKSLPALGGLNVRGTNVGDAGMGHVAALPNLIYLFLGNTKVSDAGLANLKPVLPRLVSLELFGTQVSDAGLVHLEPATKLKILDLSCKQVSDAGLKHLKTLTRLETLALNGSGVTGKGLEHLRALPELTKLYLKGTPVNDTALEQLGLSRLTHLDLGQTKITSAGLQHLKAMKQLQHLLLHNNRVDDTGLEHLSVLSNLQALYLRGTRVSDAGLEHLKGLTKLGTLDLVGTRVTPLGAQALQKAMPKCKILFDAAK
jgi:Leucine-rich repeat (LRR) protein